MIVFLISIFTALAYVWWASKVYTGFLAYAKKPVAELDDLKPISIVIPFRNEAENLTPLLNSIGDLKYPKALFEVILVNDHSTDEFQKSLKLDALPFTTSLISSDEEGKKAAQFLGVLQAKHELIACTDADCIVPKNWLNEINAAFQDERKELLFGPVILNVERKPLQQVEFLALIGSTMGMLELGWPVMGNAANMAFQKPAFFQVYPSMQQRKTPSGDDVFLLHAIGEKEDAVGLIYGVDAAVRTSPQRSLKSLFSQRIRWASKGKYYTSVEAILIAVLVFGINLMLALQIILVFSTSVAIFNFTMLLLVKSVADYFLLNTFSKYYKLSFAWGYFILQELVNIIYVPAIGILSQLLGYKWKGRKY